jgi:hypothetical protein
MDAPINLLTFREDIARGKYDLELADYMRLRAIGRNSQAALRFSFGNAAAVSANTVAYIDFIECSDAYIDGMPKAIASMKHVTIWSPELSARNLAAIASDTTSKTSDRLNAIKELNVIYNITVIDENGKTKAGGMTLKDFYQLEALSASNNTKPH